MTKQPSKVPSSHVGNPPVASIYCCECCGGQGHEVSACPSATPELGQGNHNEEVSFAQGQGFHGNFSPQGNYNRPWNQGGGYNKSN
ncbi:hypothetical protein LINPERHAP1_LOCUS63, partial [Linum perenne]